MVEGSQSCSFHLHAEYLDSLQLTAKVGQKNCKRQAVRCFSGSLPLSDSPDAASSGMGKAFLFPLCSLPRCRESQCTLSPGEDKQARAEDE